MLELGTAKVEITPRFPVPLAGFATRTGVFDGVIAPLFARILCFRTGGEAPIVFVSADLIWWGKECVERLRRSIRMVAGLEKASLVLHATHNHSGPRTSEAFSPSIGEHSSEYLRALENSVASGVRDAVETYEQVAAERGAGLCEIGVHRRRPVDGRIRMAPNLEGPNDSECSVIRFRTLSGRTKALFVHFACHPTTTADNLVSAEFCGAAMEDIERQLGNSVVAAYLQGCCGDIRPALIGNDGEFYRGSAEDVRRLGYALSGVVFGVLSRPMKACEPFLSSASVQELPLCFEANVQPGVALEMTKITVARNLGFLTFNSEMVVEYGAFVKRFSAGAILPVAYSNGMIGYVTTERQLAEGGYEAREAFRYFGMPGPFAASTERRIYGAIVRM